MIRHLRNFNELVIYASLSTGLAFFVRLHPSFFFPVLLLRLSVVAYALFILGNIEHNKAFAYALIASIGLGLIGGYWDLIELNFTHNQTQLLALSSIISALSLGLIAVIVLRKYDQPK
jgi:hypothetical protein